MTAYVDDMFMQAAVRSGRTTHRSRWCHLTADTVSELNAFAVRLGLRTSYFQSDTNSVRGGWHYDVTEPKRRQAVALGAVEVTTRQMLEIMRQPARETQQVAIPS